MSLIQLKEVWKTYVIGDSTRHVLREINLEIPSGEFVAIVGASGSGKSTLMNIIGLLDQPTRGQYFFEGRNDLSLNSDQLADIRNRRIGFVFQFFYLLPRLTALQNVMLPLQFQDAEGKNAQEEAMHWLSQLGVHHVSEQKPSQLSGGQQQRVAIARALITNPALLLADEPTGALDSKTSDDILNLFLELHEKTKKTIVMVTHNPQLAKRCQRVITLNDGEIIEDRKN